MTAADLWIKAARDARELSIILDPDLHGNAADQITKALQVARTTTAGLEALQRLLAGVPEPRSGE